MLVAPAPELVDVHPKFLSHRLQRSTALLSQRHRFGLELRHEPASRPGHWSPSGWNRSTLATRPFRRGKLTGLPEIYGYGPPVAPADHVRAPAIPVSRQAPRPLAAGARRPVRDQRLPPPQEARHARPDLMLLQAVEDPRRGGNTPRCYQGRRISVRVRVEEGR